MFLVYQIISNLYVFAYEYIDKFYPNKFESCGDYSRSKHEHNR